MNGSSGEEQQVEPRRPTAALVKDSINLSDDYDIILTTAAMADKSGGKPMFGPYLRNRRYEQASGAAASMIDTIQGNKSNEAERKPARTVPALKVTNDALIPTAVSTPVESVVGRALKAVGAYKSLDRRAQVVALVNEVSIYSKLHGKNYELLNLICE